MGDGINEGIDGPPYLLDRGMDHPMQPAPHAQDRLDELDRMSVLAAYRMLASGQYLDLLSVAAVSRIPVEPPEGSVLHYVKTLGFSRPKNYTYVALRAGDHWYVTGRRSTPMMFLELIEDIGDNPCSIATAWAEIPTPEPSPFQDMTPAEWHAAMWPQNTTEDNS